MARRNFVYDIVDKVHMGDIYRVQLSDLNKKVDELLENDRDDIAEFYKDKLMELDKSIKECVKSETKLDGMIERAGLSPLEYLIFDLRLMKRMAWDDIVTKISETPQLKIYLYKKQYYMDVLSRATEKLKAVG